MSYRKLQLVCLIGLIALVMDLAATPPQRRATRNPSDQGMTWLRDVVFPGFQKAIELSPTTTHRAPNGSFLVEPSVRPKRSTPIQASKSKSRSVTHFSPKPARLHHGSRVQESGLTVRGLKLGSQLSDVIQRFGPPEHSHDYEQYSRQYKRAVTTNISFGTYSALFDRNQVMGAADGNGLERFGTPILACGDGPNDVFAVLGPPDSARYPLHGRTLEAEWHYIYEGFELTIRFLDGEVRQIHIREADFLDSLC